MSAPDDIERQLLSPKPSATLRKIDFIYILRQIRKEAALGNTQWTLSKIDGYIERLKEKS